MLNTLHAFSRIRYYYHYEYSSRRRFSTRLDCFAIANITDDCAWGVVADTVICDLRILPSSYLYACPGTLRYFVALMII